MRRDRTRRAQNLAALHFLALRAAQKHAHIVARLALVEKLAEHLDARAGRLHRRLDAHDLDFLADLHDAALDAARHHRAAPRDREHVFDRHQERQVLRTLRLRDIGVDRLHQLQDRVVADLLVGVLKRRQRRALDDRNVVAREVVARQKLADFHLDKLQKLRIVDLVHLVHEHHQRRNADLAGQQDVLARLRHRAIGGRNHQDRAVHLRRARDHVLHIVRMARAVDMRVVTRFRLVLHMRRRDRDPARLLFRRLVDLVIGRIRRPARLRQDLRDRSRQRRLTVIDVTDRTDVAVRLVPLKLLFGHLGAPSFRNSLGSVG